MTPHVAHIGDAMAAIGEHAEDAAMLGDERANFVCLVWADGVIQSITNTPREDLIAALRHHLQVLEANTLRPGPANGGH